MSPTDASPTETGPREYGQWVLFMSLPLMRRVFVGSLPGKTLSVVASGVNGFGSPSRALRSWRVQPRQGAAPPMGGAPLTAYQQRRLLLERCCGDASCRVAAPRGSWSRPRTRVQPVSPSPVSVHREIDGVLARNTGPFEDSRTLMPWCLQSLAHRSAWAARRRLRSRPVYVFLWCP